jgi:energy-coupling factor transport system ATP-binding protein
VVVATGLTFAYQRNQPVVRDVSLAVGSGERVALVGPNGSGKSTLGRLLVGMLRPTHGSVRLLGREPSRIRPARLSRIAGYVFQDPDLGFVAETVMDEVMAGLPESDRPAAEQILERLGLPPERFAGRNPYRLSGGEARRLSLAAALVRRPALLVLDEPTYGQDRRGYEALLEILREHVDRGASIVTATHDERLVADFARRRLEMAEGWIIADDSAGRDGFAARPAPAAAVSEAGAP